MKRTSILVLIACITTQEIALNCSYARNSHGVRYSMYAFSHKNPSGLVPRHTKYSLYAFGFDQSGLVNRWTSYNLHAFGFNHNGLVSNYGPTHLTNWNGPCNNQDQIKLTQSIDRLANSIDRINHNCQQVTSRPSRYSNSKRYSVNLEDLQSDNPRIFMKAFLNTQIPGQYRVSNLLRIDQEVVSFNVVIENRNLIIKYWNLAKIRSLKNESDEKTEQLSGYMQKWAAVENFYDEHGEKVVHIMSPERDKVIQELAHCLKTETM